MSAFSPSNPLHFSIPIVEVYVDRYTAVLSCVVMRWGLAKLPYSLQLPECRSGRLRAEESQQKEYSNTSNHCYSSFFNCSFKSIQFIYNFLLKYFINLSLHNISNSSINIFHTNFVLAKGREYEYDVVRKCR